MAQAAGVTNTVPAQASATILLAGDEPDVMEYVRSVLQQNGDRWSLLVAPGLETAKGRSTELHADVLVLATEAPYEAASEVIRQVRSAVGFDDLPALIVRKATADAAALETVPLDGVVDSVTVVEGEAQLLHRLGLLVRIKLLQDRAAAARSRARAMIEEQRALLQRSEQRVRALLTHAKDGVAVADAGGFIRFISPGIERLLGWTEEQARGTYLWRYVHRADRPEIRRRWRELIENPMGGMTVDARARTPDGEWRWFRIVATNQLQVPGVMGVVLNFTDVEGQHRAMDALVASRERYRRVIETTHDGIWVTDENDRTTWVSERMATMLGYRPEEMRLRKPEEFMLPEDIPLYHQRMVGRSAGVVETYEQRFIRSDGSILWARVSATPVYQEAGRYAGSFGMLQDMTQERQHAAALQEALARFQVLIEQTPLVAVQGMDREGRITLWNAACSRLYGYTAEEAIGSKLQDLILPPEERERFLLTLRRIWDTGQPTPIEQWSVRNRSGEQREVMSTMVPVAPYGQVSGVYCMDVDITDRVRTARELEESRDQLRIMNVHLEQLVAERTDALREAVEDLESFAYSVTHELKAPLRAIHSFSSFLLEESQRELSPDTLRYLRIIVTSSEHMTKLIDALLRFSRCGRQHLSRQMLDMASIVQQSLGLQDPADLQRSEIIVGELPPCYGDETLVGQAVANLLSNAIKYSRKRDRPRIEVFFAGETDGMNVYAVRDNGIGFDPQHKDRIFQVFHRLHDVDEYEGAGVGLATVRRILKRHGGACWAESQPDQGATFYFSLPAREDTPTPSLQP